MPRRKKQEENSTSTDVSEFTSDRKAYISQKSYKESHIQFTIYPENELLDEVKILSKVYDLNMNATFMKLINEALESRKHQRAIRAYMNMRTGL